MKRYLWLGIILAAAMCGNVSRATTYDLSANTALTATDTACTSLKLNTYTLDLAGFNLTTTGVTVNAGTLKNTGVSVSTLTINIANGSTQLLSWVYSGNIGVVVDGTMKRMDFRGASPDWNGTITVNSTGELNAGYGTMIYFNKADSFGSSSFQINQNTQFFVGGYAMTLSNNFAIAAGKTLCITREQAAELAGTITGDGTICMDSFSNAQTGTLSGTTANTVNLEVRKGTINLAKTGVNAAKSLNISGGTVQITGTGGNQVADSGTISISDGTFNLNGTNETVAGLDGAGGTLSNASTVSASVLTLSGAGTYSTQATFNGGTKGLTLTKTGSGTQALTGSTANTALNATVSGGILQLGKTSGAAVTELTVSTGGTVTYLTANTNEISGGLTLNGGTMNLNGVTEAVTTLNGSGGTVNNGTLKVLSSKNNSGMTLAGTGALEIATAARTDFRVGSTHSGGTIFSTNNNTIWIAGNANGGTTFFDPLGAGTVTAAADISFHNLGYGNMVTLNNKFQIHSDKTLTLNLENAGAGTHGFTLTDTISGTGTLKIANAANNSVVLSGASNFEGTVLQTAGTLYADNGSFGILTVSGGTFSPGIAADDIGKITLTSTSQSGTTDSGKIVLDVLENNGSLQYDTLSFTGETPSFDLADGSLLLNFVGMQLDENSFLPVNFLDGMVLPEGDYSSWLDTSLASYKLLSDGAGNITFGGTAALPEPSACLLLLLGTVGLWGFRRK